jgi:hypothetical protein
MNRYEERNKHHHRHDDKCVPQETVIRNVRLAAAYVPFQFLCKMFSPLDALRKGTAFPELYSPYNIDSKYKHKNPCERK